MKVLLTTDGSESAEDAIRWFSRLPIEHSVSYEVMTVSTYQVYGMVPAQVHDEFVRLESIHAFESFQRAATILQEVGIDALQVTCLGQPADEIIRYAQDAKMELIVVGAHGVSLLEQMLIGSTSESVARHAPCSVLVVRTKPSKEPGHAPQLRITVASDCSDTDRQIATQVNALNLSEKARIDLISVMEHPYLLQPALEFDAQLRRDTGISLDRLASELRSCSDHIEKHVFEKLHVASCILNFIQNHPTNIVVVGDKGRSAIGRFFLGSVSRVLIHHAPCSVLLVRKRS